MGEIWLEKDSKVKKEIFRYFRENFFDSEGLRPNLNEISFPGLSSIEVESFSS